MTGARERASVLGRAFEALVGAVYLDAGLDAARTFIAPFVSQDLGERGRAGPQKDFKTQLQERLHVERAATPVYVLIDAQRARSRRADSAWPSRSTKSSWRKVKARASSVPSKTPHARHFAS